MKNAFETLCDSLDHELERQENILEVCAATQRAAQANDVEYLEAKTLALLTLIQQSIQAETERRQLLAQIAHNLGVLNPEPTLSALIESAPEPWGERLRFYQNRLKQVITQTRPVVIANMAALRTALRVVRQCLHHLEPLAEVTAVGYGAGGGQPLHKQYRPSVIDHKG